MPRLVLLGLLYFLLPGASFAQTKQIDSLRGVLAKHPQADTFRVNRLIDLGKQMRTDLTKAKVGIGDSAFQEAMHLANQLDYFYGQAVALQKLAYSPNLPTPKKSELLKQALRVAQRSQDKALQIDILFSIGLEPNGLASLQQALVLAKDSKREDLIDLAYNLLGKYYFDLGDYPRALYWVFQELTYNRQIQYKAGMIATLSSLSSCYRQLHDYEQALHYLSQALQIAHESGDKLQENNTLRLMSGCYLQLGRYQKAITTYQQLLNDPATDAGQKTLIKSSLSAAYEKIGNLSQALHYGQEAISLANQRGDLFVVDKTYVTLGRIFLHRHQLDSARYFSQRVLGLPYASKTSRRDVYEVLAQVYAQQGEYAKAYGYQSQYQALKDSLNSEEVTRKTTAIRFNDQMSRQQNQITLLNKDKQLQTEETRRQRQFLYASLVVVALIGVLLTLLYRNNRQKQKANRLLEQQKTEIQHQRDQTQQALDHLKTTQAQLIQKEKMASLGELTAGIAHEIQNPLNFVNNFSEVSTELVEELEAEQHNPQRDPELETEILSDLKQNLLKIAQHGSRAASIIKGMLAHSRATTGDVESTDLNALADEYLRLSYQGLRAKDKNFSCELVTQFDPALGEVDLVSQEIGRVLLNLFNNAFYAVRERQKQADSAYQPRITIRTAKTEKGVEMRVSDNGMGMPQAVQQKIFQPFFTTKPTGEGTGLGLSLSYDIITKGHGGALLVESEEGKGTEFIIQLPTTKIAAVV